MRGRRGVGVAKAGRGGRRGVGCECGEWVVMAEEAGEEGEG